MENGLKAQTLKRFILISNWPFLPTFFYHFSRHRIACSGKPYDVQTIFQDAQIQVVFGDMVFLQEHLPGHVEHFDILPGNAPGIVNVQHCRCGVGKQLQAFPGRQRRRLRW